MSSPPKSLRINARMSFLSRTSCTLMWAQVQCSKSTCFKTSSTKETKWCVRYGSLRGASSAWSGSHRRAENRLHLAHRCIFMGPTLNWKFQIRSASKACLILLSRSAPPGHIPTWGCHQKLERIYLILTVPSLTTSVINSASSAPRTHLNLKLLTWRKEWSIFTLRQCSLNISLAKLWISIEQQQNSLCGLEQVI